jgi:hypothetical protein
MRPTSAPPRLNPRLKLPRNFNSKSAFAPKHSTSSAGERTDTSSTTGSRQRPTQLAGTGLEAGTGSRSANQVKPMAAARRVRFGMPRGTRHEGASSLPCCGRSAAVHVFQDLQGFIAGRGSHQLATFRAVAHQNFLIVFVRPENKSTNRVTPPGSRFKRGD